LILKIGRAKPLNVREASARIKVSATTLYKALDIKKSYG